MTETQYVMAQFIVWLIAVAVLFTGAALESILLLAAGCILAVASAFVGAWGQVYGA